MLLLRHLRQSTFFLHLKSQALLSASSSHWHGCHTTEKKGKDGGKCKRYLVFPLSLILYITIVTTVTSSLSSVAPISPWDSNVPVYLLLTSHKLQGQISGYYKTIQWFGEECPSDFQMYFAPHYPISEKQELEYLPLERYCRALEKSFPLHSVPSICRCVKEARDKIGNKRYTFHDPLSSSRP